MYTNILIYLCTNSTISTYYYTYRNYLALNVYMALCYYKLDFYDVSQEILDVYIKKYPDSMILTNLKACNLYKLYDGKAAEAELKNLIVSHRSIYLIFIK